MRLGIPKFVTHLSEPGLIPFTVRVGQKRLGAIQPHHLAGIRHHAADVQAGLAVTAAYVEHLVADPEPEIRIRNFAVDAAVTGQQMAESIPFRDQDFVPAVNEVFVHFWSPPVSCAFQ